MSVNPDSMAERQTAERWLQICVAKVVAGWINSDLPSANLAAEVGLKYGVEVRFNVCGCGQDIDFGRVNVSVDTRTGRCLSATVG